MENDNALALAESIRSKRYFELQNSRFGLFDFRKLKNSFIKYFEKVVETKYNETSDNSNWKSALIHLKKFVETDIPFEHVTKDWIESFKTYLLKEAKSKNGKALAVNTLSSYFSKVSYVLSRAHKEGLIQLNPAALVKGISLNETERGFLTYDELKKLGRTQCEEPLLKNAFLFSALTGLRWSDIENLTWGDVQYSLELGNFIRFKQQKTKKAETLPINEVALDLLGQRGSPEKRVFENLKYSAYMNVKLAQWMMKAGITRKVTFHGARHTFATLQLTLGSDIYTVSKMLGHRNIKTTQIYARIIDPKKVEAANRITLN